jgi:hypothetical protein
MLRTIKHSFFALLVHLRRGNQGMLMVRVSALAALAGLLISICAIGQSNQEAPQAQSGNQNTASEQRGTEKAPIFVKSPGPTSQKEAAYEHYEKEEKPANERRLTYATIALTGITGFLALFTAGLWYATYKLSRDAKDAAARQAIDMQNSLRIANDSVWAAQASAGAAERTVKIMEDTAMRQLRAYVSVRMEHDPNKLIPGEKGPYSQIIPVWINSGETPTRNMKMYVGYAQMDKDLAASGPILTKVAFDQYGTVFPNASLDGNPILIQEAQLRRHPSRFDPFFIWGVAEYRDVFDGGPWRTEFCFEVAVTLDAPTASILKLTFRPHGKHNCADEECTNWYEDNETGSTGLSPAS